MYSCSLWPYMKEPTFKSPYMSDFGGFTISPASKQPHRVTQEQPRRRF
jgi:hypothetical protein